MKRLTGYLIACLVMLVTATGSLAQGANPCAGDIERFCGNVEPGKGRIADCLKQNEAQLSPECKLQHLAEVGEVLRQTQQACEVDSVKFCGSEQQQHDIRLLNCLKLNATSLSPECRTRLFEALDLMHY